MKLPFHASLLYLLFFTIILKAAEPNFVKTNLIGIGTDSSGNIKTDRVSISFTDGLGRNIQSKSNLSPIVSGTNPADTVRFLTSCTFYNDAGNPEISTKSFVSQSPNYLPGSFTDIKTLLNNSYSQYAGNSDFDRFAYTKVVYYKDPLSRVYESSVPGINNSIGSNATTKQWFFGVGKASVNISNIRLENGFIKCKADGSKLDTTDLNNLYNYLLANQTSFSDGTNYLLTVTKDACGKYSEVLKDLFGRTVGTASIVGGNKGIVVTNSTYDLVGNVLEQMPPSNGTKNISSTKYLYNTLGQVIRKETPDRAVDSFVYNDFGLVDTAFSIVYPSSSQFRIVRELIYDYDDFQRVVRISMHKNNEVIVLVENYYDKVDDLMSAAAERYKIPGDFLSNIKNCKGQLVASVSNASLNGKVYYAVDVYSYDEDGNVSEKYKFVSGLPLRKTSFTYDIHGKKTSETVIINGVNHSRSYTYDILGRLSNIKDGTGKTLASYSYDSLGRLNKKFLGVNLSSEYQYTINEQVENFNSKVGNTTRFNEAIQYKDDGNIKNATFGYNGFINAPAQSIAQDYSYDTLNRLTSVFSSNFPQYSSSYLYDTIGRFTSKIEGTMGASGYNPITNYDYYNNTNRLSKAKQTGNDYLYDEFGNLVLDKQKKMVVEYDWRDLPVRFSFYDMIPATITTDQKGTVMNLEALISQNNGARLLSTVSMMYDAGGNRVLKLESAQ